MVRAVSQEVTRKTFEVDKKAPNRTLDYAPEGRQRTLFKKEFKKYLYIARGSLYETVARLQIFLKLKCLNDSAFKDLYAEAEEINKMLSGLINSIKISH